MKQIITRTAVWFMSVTMAATVAIACEEPSLAQTEPIRIRLDLTDGSSVIGIPDKLLLTVATQYGWKLKIPFEIITSVVFIPGNENALLHLQGGDRLTVQMQQPAIRITALFGNVKVDMGNVSSITVVTGQFALPPALRNGLLAYYPFNQDEGQRTRDHSGAGRDGVVQNANWTPHGKVGGAMQFKPNGSRIVTTDDGLPMGDAARSIAFWMKLGPDRELTNVMVYGTKQHNQMCSLGMDWRLGRNSIAFSQYGGVNVARTKFENDLWYHVVYTYSGSNKHTFYINGVEDPQATRELSMPLTTISSGRLYLGSAGDGSRSFDGWLDEIMIYDRALSPTEVHQIYELR